MPLYHYFKETKNLASAGHAAWRFSIATEGGRRRVLLVDTVDLKSDPAPTPTVRIDSFKDLDGAAKTILAKFWPNETPASLPKWQVHPYAPRLPTTP